ncbi:MAG TPA: YceI family protein [Candidatus Dormibacteraeota bacterium]|nr:YceI family protein [Candidatus Dormibacteraeota bacterium]
MNNGNGPASAPLLRFWISGLRTAVLASVIFAAAMAVSPVARTAAQSPPQPATQTSTPQQFTLTLDPAQSSIHWVLDTTLHTVHGTFLLKRGDITFSTEGGKASGDMVASATSGESGNDSRDKKLHKEILESQKYQEIVFRADRIDGKVSPTGPSSVQIHGTFLLHGAEHELTVPVQEEITAGQWKGSAKFSVPYIQWGLKNPSTFLLKADPTVEVELQLSGAIKSASAN